MKRFTSKKTIIAAMAIIATLATVTTVFAAQNFNGFKKTAIYQSSVVSDVKMTITESVISDKGAVVVATFERKDGKAFAKDAIVSTLEITNRNDLSYMINKTLSDDQTKIVASLEIDSSKSLENQTLTVVADNIINKTTKETLAAGPWKISFTATNQKFVIEQTIDLFVEKDDEKMALTKINLSSLGVAVEGKRLDGKTGTLPRYMPSVEITNTDGKTIQLTFDSTNEIETGFRVFYVNKTSNTSNKVFLNASDIKEVSIDGKTITLN